MSCGNSGHGVGGRRGRGGASSAEAAVFWNFTRSRSKDRDERKYKKSQVMSSSLLLLFSMRRYVFSRQNYMTGRNMRRWKRQRGRQCHTKKKEWIVGNVLKRTLETKRNVLGMIPTDDVFSRKDSLIGGSIGAHIRHSTDHIVKILEYCERSYVLDETDLEREVVRYDDRVRGGSEETSRNAAKKRLDYAENILDRLISLQLDSTSDIDLNSLPVRVAFVLDAENPTEHPFTSTASRELAFLAHHATHHMATVRLLIDSGDWDTTGGRGIENIGLAPSTAEYRKRT